MRNFLIHWTKKIVIISLLVLIFSGTAVFSACSGGATDVTPPNNVDDGTSARPAGKTVADFLDDPKQNLYIAFMGLYQLAYVRNFL